MYLPPREIKVTIKIKGSGSYVVNLDIELIPDCVINTYGRFLGDVEEFMETIKIKYCMEQFLMMFKMIYLVLLITGYGQCQYGVDRSKCF